MSHDSTAAAELIREQGRRMTPQRQMVLDAVCEAGGHASPEDVFQLVQQQSTVVNRATIYRTLNLLCEVGLVTSTLGGSGHLVYEIAGPQPHHHLVCQSCGATQEIDHTLVAPLLRAIREQHGFSIADQTHLTLSGLCAQCRRD